MRTAPRRASKTGRETAICGRIGRPRELHYPSRAAIRIVSTGALASGPALKAARTLANEHLQAVHKSGAGALSPLAERGWSRRDRPGLPPLAGGCSSVRSSASRALRLVVEGSSPTEVQFTRRSARPGRSAWRTSNSRASSPHARRCGSRWTPSAPASRRANTTARADPPAPSTRACWPRTGMPSASRNPPASVLSARISPSDERERVGRPDRERRVRVLVCDAVGSQLVGDRHVYPAKARGGQRAYRLREALWRKRERHVKPVQCEFRKGGILHRAASGCGPPDSPPRRAACAASAARGALAAARRASLVVADLVAAELGVVTRERVLAAGARLDHEVQEVRVGRLGRRLDRRKAGVADRARRQPERLPRVVWRVRPRAATA